jgi:tRNA(Phe) wybutosine-synthesizing methylase Tyw3
MTESKAEATEIIRPEYVDVQVRDCLQALEKTQWRLMQIRNMIKADKEINLRQVNRAGEWIDKAIDRMATVNSSLVIAASTARNV